MIDDAVFIINLMQIVSECLASVLLNSSNLMRIDLEGANILAPYLVTALETVLPEREIKIASRWVLRPIKHFH